MHIHTHTVEGERKKHKKKKTRNSNDIQYSNKALQYYETLLPSLPLRQLIIYF